MEENIGDTTQRKEDLETSIKDSDQSKSTPKQEQDQLKDKNEIEMRNKYPQLSIEEIRELARFIKEFRQDLNNILNLPLIDELRSMYDRIISESIVDAEMPRYPVEDGPNPILIDPEQLDNDIEAGKDASPSFMVRETIEKPELKIVKVRKRKILDGSGSMAASYGQGDKMRTQQQIEVLENHVIAEKQEEINEISDQLGRDLRFESETWMFGTPTVADENGNLVQFRKLKALSPNFNELEQAAVWKMAENTTGGTNDFDPLIAIHQEIIDENLAIIQKNQQEAAETPLTIDQIRLGFLVREINAFAELEEQEYSREITPEAQVHLDNLRVQGTRNTNLVRWYDLYNQSQQRRLTVPEQNELQVLQDDPLNNVMLHIIDPYALTSDQTDFLSSYDFSEKTLIELFNDWKEFILEKYVQDIEPILEVVEVSSDGGTKDINKLTPALAKLRRLGIIVIAYGLGNDGGEVKNAYFNPYDPTEAGYHCRNLLDYPRKKAAAWHHILDKV